MVDRAVDVDGMNVVRSDRAVQEPIEIQGKC